MEVQPPHWYDLRRSNCPHISNGPQSVILMPCWVCHVYLQNRIKVTDSETTARLPQTTCAWVVFLCISVQAHSLHATSMTCILNKTARFHFPPAGMQQGQIPWALMVIMPTELCRACFSAFQEQTVASKSRPWRKPRSGGGWAVSGRKLSSHFCFMYKCSIKPAALAHSQVQHLTSWKQHSSPPLESFSCQTLTSPREWLVFCVNISFDNQNITV